MKLVFYVRFTSQDQQAPCGCSHHKCCQHLRIHRITNVYIIYNTMIIIYIYYIIHLNIYIYIYTYVSFITLCILYDVFMYIYIYIYLFVYVHIYIYMYIYIYIYTYHIHFRTLFKSASRPQSAPFFYFP